MSNRQKNITITKSQQDYVSTHPNETIKSMAKKFGISEAKLSVSMKIMGLGREMNKKKVTWDDKGYFNEIEFGKLYKL